jgi:Bardet-Biedl syndrome 9 protein
LFDNPKNPGSDNIMVSGADGNLNVYRSQRLIWKAKLSDPNSFSIATFVNDFDCCKGMITTLSDDCRLSVSYLGTESEKEGQVVKEGKEINYDDVDEEHRKLLGIIRASQSDTRIEPREKIIMRTQVPKRLDEPDQVHTFDGGFEHLADSAVRMPCSDGSEGVLRITAKVSAQ